MAGLPLPRSFCGTVIFLLYADGRLISAGISWMDLGKAAVRHKRCAEKLCGTKEHGEASYLIGLAAECALKAHLQSSGFSFVRQSRLKGKKKAGVGPDPLYLHFPELGPELLAQGEGILAGRMLEIVGSKAFLQGWSVKMRYRDQPSAPFIKRQYEKWLAQANEVFDEVGI